MSVDNCGKYLEEEVQKWADDRDDRLDIIVKRLPDTRSARNIIQAQNADFLMARKGFGAFHLECKSVGGKQIKLRHFRQYPTMRRWAMAGVPGFVLIHFHELQKLVIINVSDLEDVKLVGGKWDISRILAAAEGKDNFDNVMDVLMLRTGGKL